MGIDIYAEWDGMTEADRAARFTTSVVHGHTGHLREAYHGEPYATRALAPEAFETGQAAIPAATLRQRLPEVLRLAEMRECIVYGETDPNEVGHILQSYRNFVALCERKEAETGKPCTIFASY